MTKQTTAIAAAALALALGCRENRDEQAEIYEEQAEARDEIADETEEAARETGEAAEDLREDLREEQGEVAGTTPTPRTDCVDPNDPACMQPQPGGVNQEPLPTQAEPVAPAPTVVMVESQNDLNNTVNTLSRELRSNDVIVVATVRYDQAERERLMREQMQQGAQEQGTQAEMNQQAQMDPQTQTDQQAQMGQQAQMDPEPEIGTTGQTGEAIGDLRLIVIRRADQENRMLSAHGVDQLLETPRQIAIFEIGERVVIAYQEPVEIMPTDGQGESTAQILQRATQTASQTPEQQRAAREAERQQEQQIAQAGRENEPSTTTDQGVESDVEGDTQYDMENETTASRSGVTADEGYEHSGSHYGDTEG